MIVDGESKEKEVSRPRFRVTAQRGGPKSFHPFTETMMAQALAKGIENRLGWEADTTDFDLVCVRCRECFPECGLCFDFYRVVHFSRK